MTSDFKSILFENVIPVAESNLRPIIRDKAIDTMTNQKETIDFNLLKYIKAAFEEAQEKTKEKLKVFHILESILKKDVLDKIFGEESYNKVFRQVVQFYEESKPEAGDKAADATIDALKDSINLVSRNDKDSTITDRNIFSDFKNEMKSALSDVASGGSMFNEKIDHIKSSLLDKFDLIVQQTLNVVKGKIDVKTREYIAEHFHDRSSDLMNKLDTTPNSDRGFDDGIKSFFHKAADKVHQHALDLIDNPKEKIDSVLKELQEKIATEVMEEVQKVLDLIRSNSKSEINEWFTNKFHLK
eukprot:NODE_92_length_21718_cov_0.361950.p8 type:complete len:299 gc:universal NODE_92_length_21718_cov_0.361950:360-1256(+)